MKKRRRLIVSALVGAAILLCGMSGVICAENAADDEAAEGVALMQYMDCFEPMPIISALSDECWGGAEVGARDCENGLEDADLSDYSYWDGGIIKDPKTGKYYLFASRWNQAGGHWGEGGIAGWQGSQAVYATSDSLYGPYTDCGPLWPDWCDGAGHNVFPFTISKSDPLYRRGYRYAISISDTGMHSETANGTLHIARRLSGPWKLLDNENGGKLNASGGNGFSLSNISILTRPDGRYEATNRNGDIALADSLAGEWEVVENGLWEKIDGMPSDNIEDPVIWYSDGLYRMIVNKWDSRTAYYLTSEDGLTGWKRHSGFAYKPDADFLRYSDGTVNHWTKIERPSVYIENGKLEAMTFAVVDVQKEEDLGNDEHGSKIIVVPFSSQRLSEFDAQPNRPVQRSGILPIADTSIQSFGDEPEKNYGAEKWLQLQLDPDYKSHGMGALGEGNRPEAWYDNKISYVKYDISDFELASPDEAESAFLSLIYLGKPSGDSDTARIRVTLSDSDWTEGNGKASENENRASDGAATWNNRPALHYDASDLAHTSTISKEFSTAQAETELILDVTELIKSFISENPGKTTVSFALNLTVTGTRIRIGSSEAGESFAPKLTLIKNEARPDRIFASVDTLGETEQTSAPTDTQGTSIITTANAAPSTDLSSEDSKPTESKPLHIILIVGACVVAVAVAAVYVVSAKKRKK